MRVFIVDILVQDTVVIGEGMEREWPWVMSLREMGLRLRVAQEEREDNVVEVDYKVEERKREKGDLTFRTRCASSPAHALHCKF